RRRPRCRSPCSRRDVMAIADWLFRRGGGRGKRAELDVAALCNWFGGAAARYAGKVIEPDLVRARLADRCRDVRLLPMTPEEFDEHTRDLDEEAWRRLALAVSAFDLPAVRKVLPEVCDEREV